MMWTVSIIIYKNNGKNILLYDNKKVHNFQDVLWTLLQSKDLLTITYIYSNRINQFF